MSTNTLKQALEIVYGDIKNINKRVKNLESASIGVIYNETTKSAVAYQDNVSANACPYALLNKVGGMSYKSENLAVVADKSETTLSNFIYKVVNGAFYIKKTVDDSSQSNVILSLVEPITFKANTTYYLNFFNNNNNIGIRFLTANNTNVVAIDNTTNKAYTPIEDIVATKIQWFGSGTYNVELVYKPMVSLTTATEFKQGFDDIRDSAVSSVISKDSNNTTLQTITIPSEIQALEGYGWGINDTCYNYIDLITKKFKKYAGRIKVKDLTFTATSVSNMFSTSDLSNIIKLVANNETANLFCNKLTTTTANSVYGKTTTNIIGVVNNGGIWIYINDDITTVQELYNYFNDNDYIYYELATIAETDVSQYIDDNSIQIVANGTITYDNTYQQAIPYEYLYLEKVGANNE